MRIASITMVGQFPEGIDIHVRNLKWALSEEDHIYIVTLPKIIKKFNLKNDKRVTFIPFSTRDPNAFCIDTCVLGCGFINFWNEFEFLINKYKINPEWFLFMEEDIWFNKKIEVQEDPLTITSFLYQSDYRNVLIDKKLLFPRVWEGGQLIHKDIIKRAIRFGINFSFVESTFFHKNKAKYEKKFGGNISLVNYSKPDTMDELTLYCALEEELKMIFDIRAYHLRGPETVSRQIPGVCEKISEQEVYEYQKVYKYIDLYLVISVYYIVGLWDEIKHLNWNVLKKENKKVLEKYIENGSEWMKEDEYFRLIDVIDILTKKTTPIL